MAGLVVAIIVAVVLVLLCLASCARVVKQYERGVVFRLGRLHGTVRDPGLTVLAPVVDRMYKVNMQIVTLPVPAQEGITRDNVTVRVDAVVYFRVVDAANALVRVEDYRFAVLQMAQTSLRSIIGKSDLDDLLSNREKLNQGLELMIDSPAVGWGVQVDRVEIKDVSLPETMKRSMARQAEADRERRARLINADAELQASKKLADAAREMSKQPAALQLRLLQTMVAVAAEKNSTLVLPFPVELLRFLDRAQRESVGPPDDGQGPLPEPGGPEEEAAPGPEGFRDLGPDPGAAAAGAMGETGGVEPVSGEAGPSATGVPGTGAAAGAPGTGPATGAPAASGPETDAPAASGPVTGESAPVPGSGTTFGERTAGDPGGPGTAPDEPAAGGPADRAGSSEPASRSAPPEHPAG
ncbi:slipin family protein [Streptomyces sp. TS71-3]|uniref:slipin family protein n=1 Tax=Streptomyces sp. TS71-3 TaxID=2733862 RepID=UPI001AFEFA47|nr:slipin family protein [Streptomyces sp. TS71-3]GHJ42394.1 hypothetical protein Sm713_80030 [Streptomyces sp. TS71-3]